MPDHQLLTRSAIELAGLVRSGEISARELVDLSLARIEALDPELGAFLHVDAARARQTADGIGPGDDRPFAGVPIAIKNNRAVAGLPLTFGSAFTPDSFVPDRDHNVTARLRAAGFVIVGTTKLPEWGILPVTDPSAHGPARNPWDPSRTSGGSSGGSATAVAAGMVPVAHANDGGGSTRIPAACCGLVGLKPQRGRISFAPDLGQQFLGQDGVLTRTVAETAALLDLLAGPVLGDSSWAPPPAEPFAVSAAREPGRQRIAVTTSPPLPDAKVAPEFAAAVADTAELLASLGHEVVEADPPWTSIEMLRTFTAEFGPAVCTQMAFAGMLAGREPTAADVEPLSWWLWETCREIDSISAALASAQLQGFARMIVTWADPYDAILTPALAEVAVPLGEIDPRGPDPAATFARSGTFTPFTAGLNITGQPAISLPIAAREEDGLPVGVQLIGRPESEGALLSLAAQLEAARPWADRLAPPAT
ncbi:MAG: amidase [Solirubrobacteraceae bacterium]|nr:amidase [Solirubrobacteraceae bacterium]